MMSAIKSREIIVMTILRDTVHLVIWIISSK